MLEMILSLVIRKVLELAVSGMIGNGAYALAHNRLEKITEKFNHKKIQVNHDLQKAVSRAYLLSLISICKECIESVKGNIRIEEWLRTESKALEEERKAIEKNRYNHLHIKNVEGVRLLIATDEKSRQEFRNLEAEFLRRIVSREDIPGCYKDKIEKTLMSRICGFFSYELKSDKEVKDLFHSQILSNIDLKIDYLNEMFEQGIADLAKGFSDIIDAIEPISAEIKGVSCLVTNGFESINQMLEQNSQDLRDVKALFKVSTFSSTNVRTKEQTPLTPQICHHYIMPKYWTGRNLECRTLDKWLANEEHPICALIGIGGSGKSSLVYKWLIKRVVPTYQTIGLNFIFQFSFYEGEASFTGFIDKICNYLRIDKDSKEDSMSKLIEYLREHRGLVILDGFERLLRAYASMNAAYLSERPIDELNWEERQCSDIHAWRFLRAIGSNCNCKVILTSRLLPKELDAIEGCFIFNLNGLSPEDTLDFFRSNSIKGTAKELLYEANLYGFHPLSLAKLVSFLKYEPDGPNDIRFAPKYEVTQSLKARQHHILEQAFLTLPLDQARFLAALAASPSSLSMTMVKYVTKLFASINLFEFLMRMEEDNWVMWNKDENAIDFHPVVRRYLYSRLSDKHNTHMLLINYWKSLINSRKHCQLSSLEDYRPYIELYHHTIRAGLYDEAYNIFYNHISVPLYYNFGVYQTLIELVNQLFLDGSLYPEIEDKTAQAWTLNQLANYYSCSGQDYKAIQLYAKAIALDRKINDQHNLGLHLINLASAQSNLGKLKIAIRNNQRALEAAKKANDEMIEAMAWQELGKLFAICGDLEQAKENILHSIKICRNIKIRDDEGLVHCSQLEYSPEQKRRLAYRREGVGFIMLSICSLIEQKADTTFEHGKEALTIANECQNEYNIIRAKWLIGESLHQQNILVDAERFLNDALIRTRNINLLEYEPEILLSLAKLKARQAREYESPNQDNLIQESRDLAFEAMDIAIRCDYRLTQSDIHNFLAEIGPLLEGNNFSNNHANLALKKAWCEGPPFAYNNAIERAQRLLKLS